MAQHTRQPEVLRELFEALGNDPAVIAECLGPADISRAFDRRIYRRKTKLATVESPQPDALRAMSVAATLGKLSTLFRKLPTRMIATCTDDTWTATSTTNAPVRRAGHTAVWTGSEMIVWGGDSGKLPEHRREIQSQHG